MGVIQSSINQAIQNLAIRPALSRYSKEEKKEKELQEHEKTVQKSYANEYLSRYGQFLGTSTSPMSIEKQQQALQLMEEYKAASEYQRKATKARIAELGGETSPEGKIVEQAGQKRKQEQFEQFSKALKELGGK